MRQGRLTAGLGDRQKPKPRGRVDVRDQARAFARRRRHDRNGRIELQRAQQPGDAIRFGGTNFKLGERQSPSFELGRRASIGVPLDERGRYAAERNRAIGRDGDEPVERATAHGLDVPERFGGGGDGGANIGRAHDPGGQARRRPGAEAIEGEPTRPRRRRDSRIWRDNLKECGIAEAQQQIVGRHARVLAADLRRNAEGLRHEGGARFKREGGNGDVIEERARHPKPPNEKLTQSGPTGP